MNSGDIPWNLGLKNRPKIYGIGTSNQSVPEMAMERSWTKHIKMRPFSSELPGLLRNMPLKQCKSQKNAQSTSLFNQSGKAHESPKSCVWNVPQCTLSGPCGENGSGFSNESSTCGICGNWSSKVIVTPCYAALWEQQKSSERCADGMVCLLGIMIALKQSKIRHSRVFFHSKTADFPNYMIVYVANAIGYCKMGRGLLLALPHQLRIHS